MRDDKVKGLEHQIEMKVQDLTTLKKVFKLMVSTSKWSLCSMSLIITLKCMLHKWKKIR